MTVNDQVFCVTHSKGPFNEESETKEIHSIHNNNCKFETYNPEIHNANYKKSKINKDKDDESNAVEKIYDFAKNKIKKTIVSKDDGNQVFILIEKKGHLESLDINSTRAKNWIKSEYYDQFKSIFGDDAYKNALGMVKALAVMNEKTPREKIYNRIAMTDNETIFYDIADPEFNLIKISKDGVETMPLSTDTPIFVRKQHHQQQYIPQLENNDLALDDLTDLLRLKNSDRQIFQVHLTALFLEKYPIPIMPIVGEHGSIKSTITRTVKQIVDPSGEGNGSLPRSINDLIIYLYNRYLPTFDNVSEFNQEISDIMCKAITGDSQTRRELYENNSEMILTYRRKIIFNGIAPTLDFPDLRDRCLSYETTALGKNERLTEEIFNMKLESIMPQIIGKIFNTLSKAFCIYDDVKNEIKNMPRMADFMIYGECISRALDFTPLSFASDYEERIQSDSVDLVETYPIIQLIEIMLKDTSKYTQTVSSFFRSLKALAENDGIEIDPKVVDFPSAANKVKPHLEKIKPQLRDLGFTVSITAFNKRTGEFPKGSHIITIKKPTLDSEPTPNLISTTSTTSTTTKNSNNHDQITKITGRDDGRDSNKEHLPIITESTTKTGLVDVADVVEINTDTFTFTDSKPSEDNKP